MESQTKTVEQYPEAHPLDRREPMITVRQTILANFPGGYEEVINWGMITYQVSLAIYLDAKKTSRLHVLH